MGEAMSLGNLSVRVTADVGNYTYAMDGVALTAKEKMGESEQAVRQFKASLVQSSGDVQKAAMTIGGSMEAANDAIVSSSEKSVEAIQGIAVAAEEAQKSMGQKIASAFGNGIGAGMVAAQTAIAAFVEYTKVKAIVISVAIGALLAGTVAGAAYTAYKAVMLTVSAIDALAGAAKGMMTGDFFKSENIDAAIAMNDKIVDLQKSLQITAIEAGALRDALNRLGVAPSDYTAVYNGMAAAIRSNTDELDRLGVQYKKANGDALSQEQVLQNAKTVLDQYRDGWDRAQAAAAIGMGTYEQIAGALKVNSEEVGKSAARLNEYQLGMSQYGQEALTKYQQTMREFDNENKLFAEGMKRVYSDAVLPAYTAIANVFKDGWPSIVRGFRVVVSSIVGLGYAMADGIYIAVRSVTASLGILNTAVNGVDSAVKALKNGDLKGAGAAIANIWESSKSQVKAAGKDMVDVIMANDKAIKLATGTDGRDTPIDLARGKPKAGRLWEPKPKEEAKGPAGPKDDPAKKVLEGYLKEQEEFVASEKTILATREQFMQGYYSQEYMTAVEFYGRKQELVSANLKTELDAYDREIAALIQFRTTRDKEQDKVDVDNKVAELQRKKAAATVEANKQIGQSVMELGAIYRQFELGTREWAHQRDIENQTAAFNIDMMGRNTLEVQKLTEARRIDLEVQQRIYELRKKDPNADVSAALAEAEKQKAIAMQMIQTGWDKQTSGAFGAAEAMRKYGEEARNIGTQVENVMTNAFKGVEDAFVKFTQTGKLSFKDLISSITADLSRMSIKSVLSSAMDSFKGSDIGKSLMNSMGGVLGKLQTPDFNPNAGSAVGAVAGAATGATKAATDAAATTASSTAMTALSTSATATSTAFTTVTTSATALETASATLTTGLGALAAAAQTTTAAMTATGTGSAGGAVVGTAGAATAATDATSSATAAASMTALGTAATTSTAALATMDASTAASSAALTAMTATSTALDAVSATLVASFGALAAAAEVAAAAMASSGAAGGASGLGSLAGLAGASSAGGDSGMAAMIAGSFAGGGDPLVGRVSLVGEKGPELFVPKTAGTIIPNDFFKQSAANDSGQQPAAPNITINNHFPENTNRDTINQAAAKQSMQVQRAMRSIG